MNREDIKAREFFVHFTSCLLGTYKSFSHPWVTLWLPSEPSVVLPHLKCRQRNSIAQGCVNRHNVLPVRETGDPGMSKMSFRPCFAAAPLRPWELLLEWQPQAISEPPPYKPMPPTRGSVLVSISISICKVNDLKVGEAALRCGGHGSHTCKEQGGRPGPGPSPGGLPVPQASGGRRLGSWR